jgi:Trypsin-co-occurring domain 1
VTNDIGEQLRIVEVQLPNGAVALVRANDLGSDVAEKVGWPDRFDFGAVAQALEGIADAIRSAVSKAKPTTVRVELGIELAVKSGKLVGLIVEGEGTGSLTVTLEWKGDRPDAG